MDLAADLQLVLDATRAAGTAVMRRFRRHEPVHYKSPDQPVTRADLEANQILHARLAGARPAYGWLSEETADAPERLARDRVWVVDPLDGTQSFIEGRPEFMISVALAVGGQPALGVLLNPATGECYHALAGGGAFRDGAPIRTAAAPPPGEARVLLASRAELRRGELAPLQEGWEVRPLGSTACKLSGVAAGAGHAFVSRGPKSEWDVCAGALLVREAGGWVGDVHGEPYAYNRPDPSLAGLVCAAAGLQAGLLRRLAELPPLRR